MWKALLELLLYPGAVMLLVFMVIEQMFPAHGKAWQKQFASVLLGVGCVIGLHAASLAMMGRDLPAGAAWVRGTFFWGPGYGGYLMAGIIGFISGALAPVLNDQFITKYVRGLKKSEEQPEEET